MSRGFSTVSVWCILKATARSLESVLFCIFCYSETSNGDTEKANSEKFVHAREAHVLNVYRIKMVLQAERVSVMEGYKELVKQDSSLMPLESSQFQEDDEIVGITVSMIQKT